MTIDLLFPVLPPTLDGIGDHTARLAEALSEHATVRVRTAQTEADPIPGATVDQSFTYPPRRGVLELVEPVVAHPPDWLVVQFNQFSYGRWGLNPFLPLALFQLRRRVPELQIAVMFHEDFVPVTNWKNAIMTTWQRLQFWALGRLADQVFFSIDPWVQQYDDWFPSTRVNHLPVGSNMPYVEASRSAIRQTLDIAPDTFVLGVFGSLHASRLLGHIHAAAEAVQQEADDLLLLYVGPHGSEFMNAMPGLPVLDAGPLPPEDVSRHFQAMDVHLAPFMDGVSTRRGSFMTGLQHGVPTVSTCGPLTDNLLSEADGTASHLAPVQQPERFAEQALHLYHDPALRTDVGEAGRQLYVNHFAFSTTAERLAHHLSTEVTA